MTMYHPMATVTDKNGKEQQMFCYDSVESLEKCFEVFDFWENEYGYKIETAHVQVIEDGKSLENRHYEKRWVQING